MLTTHCQGWGRVQYSHFNLHDGNYDGIVDKGLPAKGLFVTNLTKNCS